MAVVGDLGQLLALDSAPGAVRPSFPVVVQPYVPHAGVVYKVYVVGLAGGGRPPRHRVVCRPSLRLRGEQAASAAAAPVRTGSPCCARAFAI